ncbi:MAG: single-stranded DNA-binding protein [Atopobiaceae bacterium]|nr:single-stranded DNA-binding protein [Atopobiaceae bacterium]
MSINQVSISGNLTRDSELRSTQGGTAILSFVVAVNDRVKGQDGQWTDRPNFVDCILFGTRAQSLKQYLVKGTKVAIAGKLRYSSWQAQDGSRRSKLEVVADDLEFLSRQQWQQAPQYAPQQPQYAPQQYAPQQAPKYAPQQAPQPRTARTAPKQAAPQQQMPVHQPEPEIYDEDIPF